MREYRIVECGRKFRIEILDGDCGGMFSNRQKKWEPTDKRGYKYRTPRYPYTVIYHKSKTFKSLKKAKKQIKKWNTECTPKYHYLNKENETSN